MPDLCGVVSNAIALIVKLEKEKKVKYDKRDNESESKPPLCQ